MQFFLKNIGIALGKQIIYDNKRLHGYNEAFFTNNLAILFEVILLLSIQTVLIY